MHFQLNGLMFWHFATTNEREWPKKIAFFREFHILENFLTFIMGHLIPLLLLQERCMMMFSFQMCGRLFKIRESSTDFRRIEKYTLFCVNLTSFTACCLCRCFLQLFLFAFLKNDSYVDLFCISLPRCALKNDELQIHRIIISKCISTFSIISINVVKIYFSPFLKIFRVCYRGSVYQGLF